MNNAVDAKSLTYDFSKKIKENDIIDFINISYQEKFIMWEWFPVGSSNFEIKNNKLTI